MNVIIRDVTADDFSEISLIYNHYAKNTAITFDVAECSASELEKKWLDYPSHPYIVASVDNQIVGYAYVSPYHPRCAYHTTVEDSIYVGHEYKKRGHVGSRLVLSYGFAVVMALEHCFIQIEISFISLT